MRSRSDAGRAGRPATSVSRRQVLRGLAAGAGALAWPSLHAQGEPGSMARIRARGSLVVGLYQDLPPFHEAGRGIDVALGQALAQSMNLRFQPLPFHAGENMGDDLRNMVWRGHYLGWGPADVLLHVPLDPPLLRANPQVQVVAPYYRERVMLAVDTRVFPRGVESLADLKGRAVVVPGLSLAGWLMIGADGGVLRETLNTRPADGVAAAKALQAGEAVAAAGLASELESVLARDERWSIQPLPTPRAPRDGWAVGCAVRKDATELAEELQKVLQALRDDGRLQAMFRESGVTWRL